MEELKALEEKVDALISLVGRMREENKKLKEELSKANERLRELEELEKQREQFLKEKKDMEDRIRRIFTKLVNVVNKEGE